MLTGEQVSDIESIFEAPVRLSQYCFQSVSFAEEATGEQTDENVLRADIETANFYGSSLLKPVRSSFIRVVNHED